MVAPLTDAGKTGSVLQALETQVASCGNLSNSDNICAHTINLQEVKNMCQLKCVGLMNSGWVRLDLIESCFLFTGGSRQPPAVQVRVIVVPGCCRNSGWKQTEPCRCWRLYQNLKIRVVLQGDAWPNTTSCSTSDRKFTRFFSFLIAVFCHFLSVPVVMNYCCWLTSTYLIYPSVCAYLIHKNNSYKHFKCLFFVL